MAIASESPWVVPAVEAISPLPTMIILTGAWYVLIRICAIGGQVTLIFRSAACLMIVLKAFVASTIKSPSVSGW